MISTLGVLLTPFQPFHMDNPNSSPMQALRSAQRRWSGLTLTFSRLTFCLTSGEPAGTCPSPSALELGFGNSSSSSAFHPFNKALLIHLLCLKHCEVTQMNQVSILSSAGEGRCSDKNRTPNWAASSLPTVLFMA